MNGKTTAVRSEQLGMRSFYGAFSLRCHLADPSHAHQAWRKPGAYRFQEESLPFAMSGEICFSLYEAWKQQYRQVDLP